MKCRGKISNQLMLMMVGMHHHCQNDGEMRVGRVRVPQRGVVHVLMYWQVEEVMKYGESSLSLLAAE